MTRKERGVVFLFELGFAVASHSTPLSQCRSSELLSSSHIVSPSPSFYLMVEEGAQHEVLMVCVT